MKDFKVYSPNFIKLMSRKKLCKPQRGRAQVRPVLGVAGRDRAMQHNNPRKDASGKEWANRLRYRVSWGSYTHAHTQAKQPVVAAKNLAA